jgi:hypothetical protein
MGTRLTLLDGHCQQSASCAPQQENKKHTLFTPSCGQTVQLGVPAAAEECHLG